MALWYEIIYKSLIPIFLAKTCVCVCVCVCVCARVHVRACPPEGIHMNGLCMTG